MKLCPAGLLIIVLSIISCGVQAQKRGNVWCFGHEAAINFNSGFPVADSSSVISRGSCASICDSLGSLLFYVSNDTVSVTTTQLNGGKIYGKDHQLISGGDSINSQGWYYELIIIPAPNSNDLYYVFSIGVTAFYGIYYSVIDMSLNGGFGEVTQKNVQLQNFANVDCLTAIKHGNGRDWWIVFRQYNQLGSNNLYYRYLISPNGISNVYVQTIGSSNSTNSGNITFNSTGVNMMFTNLMGQMEYFDFDRCNGILSNPRTIFPEQSAPFTRLFWDGQFSPSGNLFYTTLISLPGVTDSCFLIQYNLNASNIAMSADTLEIGLLMNNMSHLKLGPDNKIYLSSVYNNLQTISYPYPDTVYSIYNSYLGVINSPDNIGAACDFQPYSFYLGGKRTYYGLPNNPDYDLPALAGSSCDTLVSQNELAGAAAVGSLHVYYHPAWEKAFINASNLKGKTGKLLVYDMQGKVVHSEPLRIQNGYYTMDLSMAGYANGMYLVTIQTEKEQLTKKLMID
ncbi:MAG: T9SS type A sorting domain-containing protein [Bacteroidia bacterium]|nr:T9SS type A sorting domain-containing protein [Bacteroidia bacterium]